MCLKENDGVKNIINKIIIIVASIISIIGYTAVFDIYNNKIVHNGKFVIYALLIFFMVYVSIKALKKKVRKSTVMFSCILMIIYIASFITSKYLCVGVLPTSKMFYGFIFLKAIALTWIFYVLTSFIYAKFGTIQVKKNNNSISFFKKNKKSILMVAGFIFLFYLPYLIDSFPGNLTYDFVIQIKQALGYEVITNHHPYVHTLFVRFVFKDWKDYI